MMWRPMGTRARRRDRRLHHRGHARHLRHRIFFSLGLTIVVSVVVAGLVVHSASRNSSELAALRDFASDRFAAVWSDPARRADLVASIRQHFHVRLTLLDDRGQVLERGFDSCSKHVQRLEVVRLGRKLGEVEACVPAHQLPRGVIYGLVSLVLVLWVLSGFISRRLVWSLDELVRVVREIGDGRLDARIRLCHHHHRGEVGEVARAVNLMAEKIERQIAGQRELLAAVSHEIRSPMARLRVLVELAREQGGNPAHLDGMELELSEMDALVGQLLAQSRLEFQVAERKPTLAIEAARVAIERANLDAKHLVDAANQATIGIDASLFGRALLNLIENAQRHGCGLTSLTVRSSAGHVQFEVLDHGPGFEAKMVGGEFEPFMGSTHSGGLGLGLSLVDRIARAHGGRLRLTNPAGGGAMATIELPVVPVGEGSVR